MINEAGGINGHRLRLIGYDNRSSSGFIMDSSTGLDDARPENVRAMFDFTKQYGIY